MLENRFSLEKTLSFTEVQRLLKVRNISRSKIKTVGSPSLVGTVWPEGLKPLCYANRFASHVCSCSHLLMVLLMARSVCSMIGSADISGTVAEHEPQHKGQESQLND